MSEMRLRTAFSLFLSAIFFGASAIAAPAEQVTFRQAVDLALKNSAKVAIAKTDQQLARQNYLETRAAYLPQLAVSSGLAYSNGFPLSLEGAAPAVFNLNSTQFLVNMAQREYMRAAKSEWSAVEKLAEGRRADVILETASVYAELDKLGSSLSVLGQQASAAARAEKVSKERLEASVDSEVDYTRMKLASARVRAAIAQAQGQADVLRLRLGQLTGLPGDSIETVSESIPALPIFDEDENVTAKAIESSSTIQAATDQATAKERRAEGERKQLYPSINFATQYAVLARFNNYDEFFQKFQRNNVTAGLVLRFPILNSAQRAHAEAAKAEALKARKEVQDAKDQVATESIRMQRAIKTLAANRDVAKLEYQLAKADAEAVNAKAETGTTTVRDLESARVVENQRYADYLNSEMILEREQMKLLRATGDLEKWAMGDR